MQDPTFLELILNNKNLDISASAASILTLPVQACLSRVHQFCGNAMFNHWSISLRLLTTSKFIGASGHPYLVTLRTFQTTKKTKQEVTLNLNYSQNPPLKSFPELAVKSLIQPTFFKINFLHRWQDAPPTIYKNIKQGTGHKTLIGNIYKLPTNLN